MLLTAQPLHAFDLDKVPGGALIVRTAAEGEKMTTLDDVERSLDAETVLVCDANGPTGIAGIMGGQVSEVSDETTRVLLEVANWNGTNILRTSRLLGLRSEASSRFEKQLHPELCMRAQRIASRLMVELCGAKLVPGTIDVAAEIPAPPRLQLRAARVEGLLGMEIAQADQVAYLERLGFGVEADGEDLEVTVPPDRHYDVTREVDLIEEVGAGPRLRRAPADDAAGGGRAGRRPQPRAAAAAPGRGRAARPRLRPGRRLELHRPRRGRRGCGSPPTTRAPTPVLLANPLSEDQSAMRTTLLGSLLDVASRNLARDADAVALFESGQVYLDSPPTGRNASGGENRPVDPLAGDFRGRAAGAVHGAAPARGARGRAAGRAAPGAAAASRPTSSRSRACWRRSPAQLGVELGFARGGGAVPAPGPRRRGRDRRRRRRLDRRDPPAGLPRLGPRGRGRLRNRRRRRCSAPPPSARRSTRTSPPSPPSTRTSPSSSRPR